MRKSNPLLVGIAFLSFAVLGLNAGTLSVAWPSIRDSFGVSLDAVGALMLASMVGFLLISVQSGRVLARLGLGPLLMVSCAVGGLGMLGWALAPAWWVMVALALIGSIGGTVINAGMNTYFATHQSASVMNWLHACFGLGGTLSPAMMTFILNRGYSWRWGYGLMTLFYALLVACFGLTLKRWPLAGQTAPEADANSAATAHSGDTLRLPAVWLSVVLFFTFTGMEGSAGQWPYTLFTEARGVDPATAGLAVSAYWASMTVGRILFGIVVDRIRAVTMIRIAMAGVICGAALVWWGISDPLDIVGLTLIGFSAAPMNPVLTSNTPDRLGAEHAANAIGFQLVGVRLGLAAVPALAGVLADAVGLEIIGPYLFVVAVAMFLLHEATVRWGRT